MIPANDPNWSKDEREAIIYHTVDMYMKKRTTTVFADKYQGVTHSCEEIDSAPSSTSESSSDGESDEPVPDN